VNEDLPVTIDPAFVHGLEERAARGEAKAMFDLGCLHDIPVKIGVPLDLGIARGWYTRAAEAGHPWAQFALGNMMERAQGGPRNDLQARRWYDSAARQGVAEAQMHLGDMLQAGRGGPADLPEAARWYDRAAAQGHEVAATRLALLHLEGRLPEADPDRARSLLEFAADKLDGQAHLILGDIHLRGIGVPRHGGLAVVHYCVAVLRLAPGHDADRALAAREHLLSRQPQLRDEYESQARAFVAARLPGGDHSLAARREGDRSTEDHP